MQDTTQADTGRQAGGHRQASSQTSRRRQTRKPTCKRTTQTQPTCKWICRTILSWFALENICLPCLESKPQHVFPLHGVAFVKAEGRLTCRGRLAGRDKHTGRQAWVSRRYHAFILAQIEMAMLISTSTMSWNTYNLKATARQPWGKTGIEGTQKEWLPSFNNHTTAFAKTRLMPNRQRAQIRT